MRHAILFLLCSMALCRAASGPYESLTLAWDAAPSHGTNISYVLKWGEGLDIFQENFSGIYPNIFDAGTNTAAVVTNPPSGVLYFVVVARTTSGIESGPSNLLLVTNYPAQPIHLRMTTNTLQTVKLEGTRNGGSDWQHLADVTNEPVVILGGMRSMLLRATTIKPPLP